MATFKTVYHKQGTNYILEVFNEGKQLGTLILTEQDFNDLKELKHIEILEGNTMEVEKSLKIGRIV